MNISLYQLGAAIRIMNDRASISASWILFLNCQISYFSSYFLLKYLFFPHCIQADHHHDLRPQTIMEVEVEV